MSYLIKDRIHGVFVDSIYNEIFSRKSNYYYFIGKVLPWSNPLEPDVPLDTQSYEYDTRNNIILLKKILISDVSFVVPRRDWTINTVYDQFDGDYSSSYQAYSGATKLKDSTFYVLTSEFNVYKCLFNNNNALSTIEPFGTDPTTLKTSDGYVWKYLYTIPLSIRNRFLTDFLMPVQKSVFNSFYSNGEIDRIIVDSYGSGYFGNSSTILQVLGEFKGSSGNSIANLIPVINEQGSITSVKIKDQGNNYLSANISIIDNSGTGSSFYKNLSNVIITEAGDGYTTGVINATTATISTSGIFQPNTNATVNLSFSNGSLVGISIQNAGSGYSSNVVANTTLSISTSGASQPTINALATLNFASTSLFTPVLLDGKIDRVLINDPGIKYDSNLRTVFSLIGDGTGASFVPFINESGEIEDVIIESRGEGYTYLDVEVVGDGSGANVQPFLSTGDLDTLQSTVELSAVEGAIHAIRVLNGGNGYTAANVIVSGDGQNFEAIAVISNTSGTISYIDVLNPGSGYTHANVQIIGNGSGANVSAIFPPQGGHGSDPVKELFADTIMFYSTINNEGIHNLSVNNDYRQFGIIRNPKKYNSEQLFSNTFGTPCILVQANTIVNSQLENLSQDTVLQLLNDTSKNFEVIDVDSTNNLILINPLNNKNVISGNVLYDSITDSIFPILSVNANPTINKFSGELLFIDNRTSVSYSDQQLVTLKTTIKL